MVGAVAGLLQHPHARVEGLPLDLAEDVLEQERHAPKGASGQSGAGLFADALEAAQDYRVKLRVEPFDAGDRSVDQLQGQRFSVNESGIDAGWVISERANEGLYCNSLQYNELQD